MEMLRVISQWLQRRPACPPTVEYPIWVGQSQQFICELLRDGRMRSAQEIQVELFKFNGCQTAGIHLPRMAERGLVTSMRVRLKSGGRWINHYTLTEATKSGRFMEVGH